MSFPQYQKATPWVYSLEWRVDTSTRFTVLCNKQQAFQRHWLMYMKSWYIWMRNTSEVPWQTMARWKMTRISLKSHAVTLTDCIAYLDSNTDTQHPRSLFHIYFPKCFEWHEKTKESEDWKYKPQRKDILAKRSEVLSSSIFSTSRYQWQWQKSCLKVPNAAP